MPETSFIREQRGNDGTVAGVRVDADIFVPAGAGVIFTMPDGTFKRLRVDTDGTLYTETVTI